jgi:copper transporter 1
MKAIQLLSLFSIVLSQALAQNDCMKDPSKDECKTFTPPKDSLNADLDALCKANPSNIGCSLRTLCKGSSSESFCTPLSILGTACKADGVSGGPCSNYESLCGSKSVVEACKKEAPVDGIPNSKKATEKVIGICKEMPTMDGCDKCAALSSSSGGNSSSSCDVLFSYGKLCKSMPDMSQCTEWKSMCDGPLGKLTDICNSKSSSSPSKSASTSTPSAKSDATQLFIFESGSLFSVTLASYSYWILL